MAVATKPELKAYDIQTNLIDFINSGNFEILNVPIKGDDRYERNGRNIRMKSIQIKGQIRPQAGLATDITQEFLRYIIVYDKQANGGTPTMGEFLRDSNLVSASSNFSFLNLDNRDRFEVLRDVSFPVPYFGYITPERRGILDPVMPNFNVDIYIPLKGKEVMFNSNNAGNAADIQTGSLYIFAANRETANNSKWQMEYCSRLRYYDV